MKISDKLDLNVPIASLRLHKQFEFGCKVILTSHAEAVRHYLFMNHKGKPSIGKRQRNNKKKT